MQRKILDAQCYQEMEDIIERIFKLLYLFCNARAETGVTKTYCTISLSYYLGHWSSNLVGCKCCPDQTQLYKIIILSSFIINYYCRHHQLHPQINFLFVLHEWVPIPNVFFKAHPPHNCQDHPHPQLNRVCLTGVRPKCGFQGSHLARIFKLCI